MRFLPAPPTGAWVIELEPIADERGWFARTFDPDEFRERGMDPTVAQCNASYNARRDTLRGLHYQAAPHGQRYVPEPARGVRFDDPAVAIRWLPQVGERTIPEKYGACEDFVA